MNPEPPPGPGEPQNPQNGSQTPENLHRSIFDNKKPDIVHAESAQLDINNLRYRLKKMSIENTTLRRMNSSIEYTNTNLKKLTKKIVFENIN